MTIQVWGSAAAILAASLLLGYALNALGLRCRAAAPAVGFAALMIVVYVAIHLPGGATTAAVIALVLVLGAVAALLIRASRGGRGSIGRPGQEALGLLGAGIIGAFGAAIPFLANGRVGLLGVSLNNDTANHLIWAQALRSSTTRQIYGLPNYYPLGPHALADAVSNGLGVRLDLSFTALLVTGVLLTALIGANAMRAQPFWKRILAGVVASQFYLFAAYYAEAAFKEQLVALFLLAFVLQLERVRRDWAPGLWRRTGVLAPAGILAAGALYVYGYPAIAWIGLTAFIWLGAEMVLGRISPRLWAARIHDLASATGVAVVVLVVLFLPVLEQNIHQFSTFGASASGTGAIATNNVGNLAHQLPYAEAFGIWNTPDFRFSPTNVFHAGELSAFALGVLILGLVVSLSRRELILPAAVAACLIVAWRAGHGQSPYVSAKALVIAGPVYAVTGVRGLLYPLRGINLWLRIARLAALAAFLVFALHSSYEALRNEPVWPNDSTKELLAFDRFTRGGSVLDLVNTDYAEWLFNDSYVSSTALNTINLAHAAPRQGKPAVYGEATDFDSISDDTLPRFDWAVTSTSDYASQPPSAFRLVRRLPMYELWHRVAPIMPRGILEKSGAPGARLNCRTGAGRQLSHRMGMAAVMTEPVRIPLSNVGPGASLRFKMPLPPGRWQLSLQYVSGVHVRITGGGEQWSMPAYLDRLGPWFAVGTIIGTGSPVIFTLHADEPASFTGPALGALATGFVATRLPDTRQLVPLSKACGRYVDWYQTSSS